MLFDLFSKVVYVPFLLIELLFQVIALVWIERSTTIANIDYYCLVLRLEILPLIDFHLHQFIGERVIITASLADGCCSFLSEWFSYKSFKFLANTIRVCFQHLFTFVKHYTTKITLEQVTSSDWVHSWDKKSYLDWLLMEGK